VRRTTLIRAFAAASCPPLVELSNLRDAVSATYPLTISVLKTRVLVFDLFNIGSIAVLLTDYVLADDWIDRRVGRSGVVDSPGAEP